MATQSLHAKFVGVLQRFGISYLVNALVLIHFPYVAVPKEPANHFNHLLNHW